MATPMGTKRVRSLHWRKYRERERRFLVQGPKLVLELLSSGWEVEAVFATAAAAERLGLRDAAVLPPRELDRLGTLESGNEVVAVVPVPASVPLAPPEPGELVLALDGIADPGNLGTVLRVADQFGVRRVLCSDGSVELYNPKCVQASMGAIFRVSAWYGALPVALSRLRAEGVALYLAAMDGRSVFEVELKRPAVLVLGSESHGLSAEVRALGGEAVSVPRLGGAESLNVAIAAAALCMEFTRRMGGAGVG